VNRADALAIVVETVRAVAPDVVDVEPDADFQADLDLDSMDVLNVMIALHDRTGVEIPEADYGALTSATRTADYLVARAA
jgi:acyl carrier protein